MKVQDINFSLVIVSNNHNPTVVSDYFLIKSGIIHDVEQIDRKSFFVTPALTQVLIDKTLLITLEPDKLNIQSPNPTLPFETGRLYCNNLVYIKATAIGYNFHTVVSDFDIDSWIANSLKGSFYRGSKVKGIEYIYEIQDSLCTVKVELMEGSKVVITSNFHKEIQERALGEIEEDFLSKAHHFHEAHSEFISTIFHIHNYEEGPHQ